MIDKEVNPEDIKLLTEVQNFVKEHRFIFNFKECYGIDIESELYLFVKKVLNERGSNFPPS